MNEGVISAISTPAGLGGVAIIRMSGSGALSIAQKIFVPSGGVEVKNFKPNFMYTGNIVCDGFTDFGLLVYFKAPKSFTGEDVVEINCHGGTQIARGVLKATIAAGARPAGCGEFTKRAFVNGKLSLSSAEGMIDMINAESLAQVRAGGLLYREKLTKSVVELQDKLKDVLAQISADIDYPEEGIEQTELSTVGERLQEVKAGIDGLIAGYSAGKLIKSGVSVAICGAPNVGKSSLLNCILGYDKAIVSPIAGTTRDAVEGSIEIDGLKYNFTDTAGIREAACDVEKIGIERARKALSSADVVLCVSDSGNFSAADGTDKERLIKVFSKTDTNAPCGNFDVAVCALSGDGVEELKKQISQKASGGKALDQSFIIEERHFEALSRASRALSSAIEALGKFPLDVLSLDIRSSWQTLGEITGETADEEIIDTVFKKFCVGK